MRLSTKLSWLFMLLATTPLFVRGFAAYESGRQAIEQDTIDRLTTITILKEAEFNRWVGADERSLRELARRPLVRDIATDLIRHAVDAPAYRAAETALLANHLLPTLEEEAGFLDLSLVNAADGQVLVSTDPRLVGVYRESEPFFHHGRERTYVQSVTHSLSLGESVMPIGTPVRNLNDEVIGVLYGHADLSEMARIVAQGSGVKETEETYLVNSFKALVTGTRFEPDAATLKTVDTEGVIDCLAHNSGWGEYVDYRGVPVIGAYRWMAQHELCIVTEIDQSEAFAQVIGLRRTVLRVGGFVALLGILGGTVLARRITAPLRQLLRGAREIGRGNLDYRLPVGGDDEIGELSTAFNEMAASLRASLGQTARGHRMVLALNKAAASVQQAVTADEVFQMIADEVVNLGYHATIFTVDEELTTLTLRRTSFAERLRTVGEGLLGMSGDNLQVPVAAHSVYREVVRDGRTIFLDDVNDSIVASLPESSRWIAHRLVALLGIQQGINAPLAVGDRMLGLFNVAGVDLTEEDVPAVEAFAHQAAIALDNARLSQETRAWAVQLERRVDERTAALADSEERYRRLVEVSPDAIMLTDLEGDVAFANQRAVELYGFDDVSEMLGRSSMELVAPEYHDLAMQNVARISEHGSSPHTDFVLLRRDGSRFPAEVSASLLANAAGEPQGMIGTSRDISERLRMVEALRESEERYRTLFDNVPVGLYRSTPDGPILDANPALVELLGCRDRDEALAVNSRDVYIDSADRDRWQALMVADGMVRDFEARWRRADGETIWVKDTARAVHGDDGQVMYYEGTVEDVTERRRIQEALKGSESQFRAIFESSPLGIMVVGPDGRLSKVNSALCTMLGYDESELRGMGSDQLVPRSDFEQVDQRMREVMTSSRSSFGFEARCRTKSGEDVWCRISGTLLDRSPLSGLAIMEDISERRRAEEAIRDLNEELEERVRQRTAELESANHELEAFAYSVSHDLRAPLRAIDGFSRILHEDHAEVLPQDARRYLHTVRDNAQQMDKLIQDLLAFSRMGRQPLAVETVACRHLVERIVEELWSDRDGREVEIVIGELPECRADPVQLRQVYGNLLANALKFTRERSKAVIEVGCRYATDNGDGTGGEPVFFVRDNGVGFDMQYADKLFGVFQRLHRAEDYEGTGVGLAIVQRAIHRHGGRVWVEAGPDKGASFYFTLGGNPPDERA